MHASLPRDFERQQWLKGGVQYIMGVDEAGRGPLAGPVVAAACILEPDVDIAGIQDSKATTEKQREQVYEQLVAHPGVYWAASVIDNTTIDDINILQATMLGMRSSAQQVLAKYPHLSIACGSESGSIPKIQCLIDGNKVPQDMPTALYRSESVVKGDAKCYSIAAASIIAKVTRDRIMLALHERYPEYNFKQHKGYPVSSHRAVLQEIGPCEEHRFSYSPVKIAADKHGVSPSPKKSKTPPAGLTAGAGAGAGADADADAGACAGVGAEASYWAPKPTALFAQEDNRRRSDGGNGNGAIEMTAKPRKPSTPCKGNRKGKGKTPVKSARSTKKGLRARKTPQKKTAAGVEAAQAGWTSRCSVQ